MWDIFSLAGINQNHFWICNITDDKPDERRDCEMPEEFQEIQELRQTAAEAYEETVLSTEDEEEKGGFLSFITGASVRAFGSGNRMTGIGVALIIFGIILGAYYFLFGRKE